VEIPGITGMRGYASLAVLFWHLISLSAPIHSFASVYLPFTLNWYSGVDFFFVLSGFLLSKQFLAKDTQTKFRNYYVRRVLRIFPLYYFSIFVLLVMPLVAGIRPPYYQPFGLSKLGLFDVPLFLVYSQNFFARTFDTVNPVYWTLAIEEIFYAILPLWSRLFTGDRYKISLPAMIGLSIAYRLAFSGETFSSFLYLDQFPSYLGDYALGTLLARGKELSINSIAVRVPTWSAVVLLLSSQVIMPPNEHYFINPFVFSIAYYLLIASAVDSSLFTNRVATSFGRISYGTYIWHNIIQFSLLALNLPLALWIIGSTLLPLVVSTSTYHAIERPFMHFARRYKSTSISRSDLESQP
jgi:peptidoglycan/LPS O-acetylase OafA/YrhL